MSYHTLHGTGGNAATPHNRENPTQGTSSSTFAHRSESRLAQLGQPLAESRLNGTAPNSLGEVSVVDIVNSQERPTELNTKKYGNFLKVSPSKRVVTYVGRGRHNNDVGAIQSDHPVPTSQLMYYFELRVLDSGDKGAIAIGFTESSTKLSRQPGWEANTYGYHGDDGHKFHGCGRGEQYGPSFTTGDVIGAGIHLTKGEVFFTKNGKVRQRLQPTFYFTSLVLTKINRNAKPQKTKRKKRLQHTHRDIHSLASEISYCSFSQILFFQIVYMYICILNLQFHLNLQFRLNLCILILYSLLELLSNRSVA